MSTSPHAPGSALQPHQRFRLLRRTPDRAQLLVDGKATGLALDGLDLQAAYAWQGLHLLLVHTGNHFEDALYCYLLSASLEVLDQAAIGGFYSTGELGALRVIGPDAIAFTFPSSAQAWHLRLLPRPSWRLPFVCGQFGVWGRRAFRRHFVLRRCAQLPPLRGDGTREGAGDV
ncbi:hypothetical protein ACG0Z6_04115 [Roseateles sp. BYS180W]|uniref:Uncharacterized protein n=1 Tax=Roseateles rivi TaxID=3299028 RepID=A0ABW7FSW2_9BURK